MNTHPFVDRIDVTQAPYNADPSGKIDSTKAIIQAIDDAANLTRLAQQQTIKEIEALPGDTARHPKGFENRKKDGRIIAIFPAQLVIMPKIYFPEGEYLISDTLGYTFDDLKNSGGSELCSQLRFIGDGPEKTIIRLTDNAEGFSSDEPKPMITVMRGMRSNVAMSTYVRNIGFIIGKGNSSAVGVDFFSNNSGAVRNVKVVSEDGNGYAGVQVATRNYSGVLLKNIEVVGCDYGLYFYSEPGTMFATAVNIKVSEQKKAGARVDGICVGLRRMISNNNVPALIGSQDAAHVNILDSELNGSGTTAIQHDGGTLCIDNVSINGYDKSVQSACGDNSDAHIHELAYPKNYSFSDDQVQRRAMEETPELPELQVGEKRCGVIEFGAVGDGEADDSEAIQKALNSGAVEIVFEPGRYAMHAPVTIPAQVRRVCFNFCDLVAAQPLKSQSGQGAFVIEGETEEPLFMEDLLGWEQWSGDFHMVDHNSTRTLVMQDLHTQTLMLYRNKVEGGKVFFDNVATTTGVIPGTPDHGRICAEFKGQKVWCHQFNPERGDPMVKNDGGYLFCLGFKSEDHGAAFETVNGGYSEILGGILNSGRPHATALISTDSEMRASVCSSGWEEVAHFGTIVREERADEIKTIETPELPGRGFEEKRGPQITLPMYASKKI